MLDAANRALSLIETVFGPRDDRGLLISIVGFDASGKTTQVCALGDRFRRQGREVVETYQPTDWYRSEKMVRHFHDAGGSTETARILSLCAAADRLRHVQEVVNPALRRGAVVICDRYVYATFGVFVHRGLDLEFLVTINRSIPRPDIAFYLEVPTDVLVARLKMRDGERLKFEERAADRIDSITETYRRLRNHFAVIDGTASPAEVTETMWNALEKAGLAAEPSRTRGYEVSDYGFGTPEG